jgi:MoaA/NifB/PqqE/SkfB family radical SAM enzyme/SAM-dependent methyltransferase
VRDANETTLAVHKKIALASRLGYSMVVLSGGEPSARPEIVQWAAHSFKRGLDFGLMTNGRLLSYPGLVDRLIKLRLRYVHLSLHGGSAEVHNEVVGAQAFEETFEAIRLLSGRGIDLTVNAVLTAVTAEHLKELVTGLLPFDDITLRFSMQRPRGVAPNSYNSELPRVSHVAERVSEALEYGKSLRNGLRFEHDGIPLCLLPGWEELHADLRDHGFEGMTRVSQTGFVPWEGVPVIHTEECRSCKLKQECGGVDAGYRATFGDAELNPVVGLRSNSFNYIFLNDFSWKKDEPCPLVSGLGRYDKERQILVREGEKTGLYGTRTNDFSPIEIREIKEDLGQLYLDVSSKTAPDDFASDLRKLKLAQECTRCTRFNDCLHCYEPMTENVFERDEQLLEQALRALEGRVLDVGCGESHYRDLLRTQVEAGRIEYFGVEPDAELAAEFASSCEWAHVSPVRVEDLVLENESYDHILILRSYNHFEAPDEVIERLSWALKPGGKLLVVDNVAFGLVRTKHQAHRGERGPSAFEHFRNHSGKDARALIRVARLNLKQSVDIERDGSNQWLLHFEKTGV